MNLKQLFADDDALSPVVAAFIVMAVTLVVVVGGAFIVGMGGNDLGAPQAEWHGSIETTTVDDSGSEPMVAFTHMGGDTIDGDALTFHAEMNSSNLADGGSVSAPREVTEGDRVTVDGRAASADGATIIDAGTEVLLVYSEPDSDDTTVLAVYEVREDIEQTT